jgi:DNA repair exonuclease SbcCD ATPase subunit
MKYMPYKDKQRQKEYKKKWRSQNKERYRLGQHLGSIRREIKKISLEGMSEENQQRYDLLLKNLEKAQKEQSELIELENQKINLQNEAKRKLEQEIVRKELENLRDKQESIFLEQHESRLKEKEKLLSEIKELEKQTFLKTQYKYTDAQHYYFKKRQNKLKSTVPTTEQVCKNKKLDIQKNLTRRKYKAMEYVWNYKLAHPCKTCGESHPAVLCFHHRDPSTKESLISKMATRGKSTEAIQKEIDKCDVLCMNCHTLHHWKERFSS